MIGICQTHDNAIKPHLFQVVHWVEEFFRERLRDMVYLHNSLLAAYAAKRHLPLVDDVWR